MKERRSFRSGLTFSFLSFGSIAVLSVVSSVIMARAYGIHVIGQAALATAPMTAVGYLSTVREQPAMLRQLAGLTPRSPRVTGLVAAVYTLSEGITIIACGLGILVSWFVFHGPLHHPALFLPAAAILAGYAAFMNTSWNLDTLFAAFRAGRELFWVRLHQAIVYLLALVALSFVVTSVWGPILAMIISWATSLVHRLFLVHHWMRWRVSMSHIRQGFASLPEIARFGLKTVPGYLATGVSNESGVWILGSVGTITAVGGYSRAWQLTQRLTDLSWRVAEMLMPTLVQRRGVGDDDGFDRAFLDTLRYIAIGTLLVAAAGGGAAPSIMAMFGPAFGFAATALAIMLIVASFVTLTSVQGTALMAVGRPWQSSFAQGARLLVTLGLSVVLTIAFGLDGTATAIAIGALTAVVVQGLSIRRHIGAPLRTYWPLREMFALVGAYAAGFMVARLVSDVVGGLAGLVPSLGLGVISFVVAFIVLGGVNERDRRRGIQVMGSLRGRRAARAGAQRPTL